jgi:hypothetical protein
VITHSNYLNTGDINLAQVILKRLHPTIGGLYCSTMGATLEFPPAQGDQWLQLIHNGSNHWVCVAKGFSQPNHVLVYDSMPSTPWKNDHILSCMSSLLYTQEKKMTYIVKSCQRQSNGYDCGVFAIAFATSLANGEDPASRLYNPKKLRAHLVDCLASGTLTPFPSDPIRAKRSWEIVQEEELFCTCRRTGWEKKGLTLLGCDTKGCEGWYHTICIKDCPKNFDDDWFCDNCKKEKSL